MAGFGFKKKGGISIHTPARGVTPDHPQHSLDAGISIHTPARGVTSMFIIDVVFLTYFNPHTREGCDRVKRFMVVSVSYFNPHTREGCDHWVTSSTRRSLNFNPHTREGCD